MHDDAVLSAENAPRGPVSWVLNRGDLMNLVEMIRNSTEVVIDLETTGLDPYSTTGGQSNGGVAARVAMASLTLPQQVTGPDGPEWDGQEPPTFILPLSHPDSPFLGEWVKVLRFIARAIQTFGKPLVNHHLKFDTHWIFATTSKVYYEDGQIVWEPGIDLAPQIAWDTQISSHLIDETQSTKLKDVAPRTFGIPPWDDHDLSYPGAAEEVDIWELGLYAARDTYWDWRLYRHHVHQLFLDADPFAMPIGEEEHRDAQLGLVARYVSMPTARSLGQMEQRGIRLDVPYVRENLSEQRAIASARLDELSDKYGLPRETASTASTSGWFRQLVDKAVELDELRITSTTPRGAPQWDKNVLRKQARQGSDTARLVLEQRDAAKQAEFMSSWLEKVDPRGFIHSTFRAGHVTTGRLCISPDTLIEMPRDMTKYPDGVPMREVKAGDWVYSYDHNMELTLRQVEWIGPTKVDRTVIVTFENSEGEQRTLQCTPDHLVRLYNGDWRHAVHLLRHSQPSDNRPGPRVLAMVRRGWKDREGGDQYLTFFPHSNSRHTPPSVPTGVRYGSTAGGRNMEHRWVMEKVLGRKLSTKWDVNHRDGNKVNNHPSNLEYLPASEHRSNTHRDGTFGKAQPGTETYMGPTDFRVVSIEEGPTIEVWDMTIPEDHQFIANGIVVHNSSASPNLQQVAKKLRPAFIARPGYVIADLDYSQLELRVAAFVSRSQPMIDAFIAGQDLHRLIAADIMTRRRRQTDPDAPPVMLDEVSADERQKGKAANFGLLYLQQAAGFRDYAENNYGVEMTDQEAQEVYNGFFATWEGMAEWHQRTIAEAGRKGYVTSPIGRVRNVPGVHSANDFYRGQAQRQAVNSPVQGFGSDLMQMAISSIYGILPGSTPVEGAYPVATVHDSLVAEVEADRWEEITAECQDRMTDLDYWLRKMGCEFDVPLVADATCGTRWGWDDVSTTA